MMKYIGFVKSKLGRMSLIFDRGAVTYSKDSI
jgi:hypothetical protein